MTFDVAMIHHINNVTKFLTIGDTIKIKLYLVWQLINIKEAASTK